MIMEKSSLARKPGNKKQKKLWRSRLALRDIKANLSHGWTGGILIKQLSQRWSLEQVSIALLPFPAWNALADVELRLLPQHYILRY
jgi:hypothetical protein